MLQQTKRISFRISSVLSKVEPEPGAGAGPSHRLRPKSTGSGTLRKMLTVLSSLFGATRPCGLWKFPRQELLKYIISPVSFKKSKLDSSSA